MDRLIVFLISLAMMLGGIAARIEGDTKAEQLLAQARQALGGEKNLSKVQGLTCTGTYERTTGDRQLNGELTIDLQLPDKMMRTETMNPMGDMTVIVEEAGKALVPGPLFTTALLAAPLLAFALPREHAAAEVLPAGPLPKRTKHLPATGWPFALVAIAFALYAFIPSALSAHMLAIFTRFGIEPATVVLIGALFGPAQVTARFLEFTIARRQHPLVIARFAIALLIFAYGTLTFLGVAAPAAAAFAILFGMTNGLMTIARGTVPLALFGLSGYGRLLGRIAGPALVMQAVGPLVLAYVAERYSDPAALALIAAFALAALLCFAAIRRP